MIVWSRVSLLAGLFGAVLLGGALLPGENETMSMLVRDQKFGAAYEQMSRHYSAGDRRPQLLLQFFKLNEERGNVPLMEDLLKAYLEQVPDDLVMHDKLTELYYLTLRNEDFMRQLERVMDLRPRQSELDRLIKFHEVNGRSDEELRLLEKYRTTAAFSSEHAGRLGLIYLNMGRKMDSLTSLRQMDEVSYDLDQHWLARMAMFRMLVDTNAIDEAYQRSLRWMNQPRQDNSFAYAMMQLLADRGLQPLAVSLGEAAVRDDPDITFTLVHLLIGQGRHADAQVLLAEWRRARPDPSQEDLVRYVDASIAAHDLPQAINLIGLRGIANVPEKALLSIAQELIYQDRLPVLRTVLPFISEAGLRSRPLLAARVALADERPDLARELIRGVDLARILPHEAQAWYTIACEVLGTREAFDRLAAMVANDRRSLPKQLLADYAETAYAFGFQDESRRVWETLGGRFPLHARDGRHQASFYRRAGGQG